jgi:NitT/TauT family transport system substrate-binding protein
MRAWAGILVLILGMARGHAAEPIRIVAFPLVSAAPLVIAQERGYYAEQGLEAEILFVESGERAAAAVAAGEAEFGIASLTAGLFSLAGEGSLRIIGGHYHEVPGFRGGAYIASTAAYEAGLTTPEAFPGHSFAVTTYGSSLHLQLGLLAERLGFDLGSIRVLPLQTLGAMVAALRAGQADAAIITGALAAGLERDGHAKVIGWVNEQTPIQGNGIITTRRLLDERRFLAERFMRAYVQAAIDYHEAFNLLDPGGNRVFGPEAEALLPTVARFTGLDRDGILAGAVWIDPFGRLDVGSAYAQLAWYQRQGLVPESIDAAEVLDLTLVQGHYNLP